MELDSESFKTKNGARESAAGVALSRLSPVRADHEQKERLRSREMHLSENEGIDGKRFVVTGGLGFVGSSLCLELVRRGAGEVRSLDPRISSPWSSDLLSSGVVCIQGLSIFPLL